MPGNKGWDGTYAGFPDNVKREAKERDGHRCRKCGSTHRLEVDHLTPVTQGGSNDLDNAMTLCHDCHNAKTRAESSARMTAYNNAKWAKGKRPAEPHPSEGIRPS